MVPLAGAPPVIAPSQKPAVVLGSITAHLIEGRGVVVEFRTPAGGHMDPAMADHLLKGITHGVKQYLATRRGLLVPTAVEARQLITNGGHP